MDIVNKIKKQLTPSPPSPYMEFDICIRCGVKLPDNTRATFDAHMNKEHPMSTKQKRKELIKKHPVLIVFLMIPILIGVLGAIPLVINTITPQVFDDARLKECGDRILKFKQDLYEAKSFSAVHVDEFNYLLNDCNVRFYAYQFGEPIFDDETYASKSESGSDVSPFGNIFPKFYSP